MKLRKKCQKMVRKDSKNPREASIYAASRFLCLQNACSFLKIRFFYKAFQNIV